ncbi:hypothetical protein M011DRAFT_98366 [Sporormia fimetaria CBS 119925]|uniref:Uncharacterized protein n=1 Tax=Sporormia fimetaria CBS 119925 TaxID=1340428 RepID=A0A6A6V616_9PLEO|nr:hypothetical protein M011DRAFT_98366 [Sporormia fimetaria CBS 119925]
MTAPSPPFTSLPGFEPAVGTSPTPIPVLLLRFSFQTRSAMTTRSSTPTAAPAPMPALTPVLSPEDAGGRGGGDDVVGVEPCDSEVEVAVACIGLIVVGPTVAAKAKTLELILQQSASPQHQLSLPHFRTGAFSSCHFIPRKHTHEETKLTLRPEWVDSPVQNHKHSSNNTDSPTSDPYNPVSTTTSLAPHSPLLPHNFDRGRSNRRHRSRRPCVPRLRG